MEDSILTSSQELSLYINVIETFFEGNFPGLEKDKFWSWFLIMLTGKPYDINNLTTQQTEIILHKLREFEGLLFDAGPLH